MAQLSVHPSKGAALSAVIKSSKTPMESTGRVHRWIDVQIGDTIITIHQSDPDVPLEAIADALSQPLFDLQFDQQASAHDAEEAAIAALSEPRGAILPLQQAIRSIDQSNGLDMVDMPF